MPDQELQRLALGVEYDGGEFLGFQAQAQEPTVQSTLERALSRVADQPVRIHGSGRTDSGVHARGQVIHFDPPVQRSLRAWMLGTNSNLPPGCALTWVKPVPREFHARFSATARSYRYRIVNQWPRPVLARHVNTWIREPLDAARMHAAARVLVGEHDFTSFRASSCQADHPIRRINEVEVQRQGDIVTVDIEGNAFLHHMVRNIVGCLIEVGTGMRAVDWVEEVLAARDRTVAGVTAPATGLCLEAVRYPQHFNMPNRVMAAPDDD
ncbi:MAG: tRNA pseudouridine(38-40) synthase TruA [Xanthomonadales bacterium]|nr:tRNA pseudouridine(38-40) synthase TruA [Xanthomonadales bacterium]